MIIISECQRCHVELNSGNANSRVPDKFVPYSYCKKCHNKIKRDNYLNKREKYLAKQKVRDDTKRKYYKKVRRGDNRPFIIEFKTLADKREFIAQRRFQMRWGRCHTSRSSNYDQRVEDLVECKVADKIYRHYIAAKCEECGSELRYDEHGYKVCVSCGLIRGVEFTVLEYQPQKSSTNNTTPDYWYEQQTSEDDRPADERYSTFDYHYARAYSKRLK